MPVRSAVRFELEFPEHAEGLLEHLFLRDLGGQADPLQGSQVPERKESHDQAQHLYRENRKVVEGGQEPDRCQETRRTARSGPR